MALERAASHITVTHSPCLFQLLPWENVNMQINNSNLQYVSMSLINNIIIYERNYTIMLTPCLLP